MSEQREVGGIGCVAIVLVWIAVIFTLSMKEISRNIERIAVSVEAKKEVTYER